MKDVPDAALVRPCLGTLKVSVRLGNSVDAGEDGRGLGAAIENEDRRRAIARADSTSQVPLERRALVDGIGARPGQLRGRNA
jgi:hypothetical protein